MKYKTLLTNKYIKSKHRFKIQANRLIDSITIEKHRAIRNTELTKAPNTSALAHP